MQDMDKIVSLAKRKGFVFPSSDIYGGVEALWDYGPLGALMKKRIKDEWIRKLILEKQNMTLIDSAILMHPEVWKSSGHVENFTDPLVECKSCHARYRADHLMDGKFIGQGEAKEANQCASCGDRDFTVARQFNLMFKTQLGPVEDGGQVTYLRPETAQGIFVNFHLVRETSRMKIPFGIGQVGKAFRNEITTGNFIFRSREFEQMEIEYFVKPGEDDKAFDEWVDEGERFLLSLGLKKENLRRYEHPKASLSHYSKRTVDIEYKYPFGWGELAGFANRTDFDLQQHQKGSKEDLRYFDADTKERYTPYVIEPSFGVDRLFLALLCDAYQEIEGGRSTTTEAVKETETVLRLHPLVAPVQVLVLPLVKNKEEVTSVAKDIVATLSKRFSVQYDETGSIGRRYRRGDEIGVPFAITVDFDGLRDRTVTVRDRDSMQQERVAIDELPRYIEQRMYDA